MKTPLRVYLAVPYEYEYDSVRDFRFRHVTEAAFKLLERGYHVFSPITHSRPMSFWPNGKLREGMVQDFSFWQEQNFSFLRHWADLLAVLPLSGWRESVGVAAEIAEAHRLSVPVVRLPIDRHGYMQ
jgi:hypothetical protein